MLHMTISCKVYSHRNGIKIPRVLAISAVVMTISRQTDFSEDPPIQLCLSLASTSRRLVCETPQEEVPGERTQALSQVLVHEYGDVVTGGYFDRHWYALECRDCG